jgi:aminobenzoyl-glutamate utilization protein B
MTDAELRQAARADFERRVSGQPYVSPLPPEMKQPLGLSTWLTGDALQDGARQKLL